MRSEDTSNIHGERAELAASHREKFWSQLAKGFAEGIFVNGRKRFEKNAREARKFLEQSSRNRNVMERSASGTKARANK